MPIKSTQPKRLGAHKACAGGLLSVWQARRKLLDKGTTSNFKIVKSTLKGFDLLFAITYSHHKLLSIIRKLCDGVRFVADGEDCLRTRCLSIGLRSSSCTIHRKT